MKTKKATRGGTRKGAGRKPAPYKTRVLSFRVGTEWVDSIKSAVKEKTQELKNQTI